VPAQRIQNQIGGAMSLIVNPILCNHDVVELLKFQLNVVESLVNLVGGATFEFITVMRLVLDCL